MVVGKARLVSRKLTFEVNLDAGPEDGGVKVGGLARELGLQVAPRQVHRQVVVDHLR